MFLFLTNSNAAMKNNVDKTEQMNSSANQFYFFESNSEKNMLLTLCIWIDYKYMNRSIKNCVFKCDALLV